VSRRDRPGFDHLHKGTAMLIVEAGRLARRLAVQQSSRPLGVEPDHPVTHNVTPHPAHRRRIGACAAGLDRRQRQKPSSLVGVLAAPRQPAEVAGIEVATQRYGHRHGEPPQFATMSQTFALFGIPRLALNESMSTQASISSVT